MPQKTPTNWVGWVYFASTLMVLVGCMQVMAGLVALFKDSYYVVSQNGLLALNYTAWGWVHLALGVLIIAAGAALWTGKTWAIVIATILAVLGALSQLAFLSAYPIWSIIAVAVNVLVIYALTMHGTEVRAV